MTNTIIENYSSGAVALIVAIALGTLLGRLRFKGFSLGIGGILIASTFAGYIGMYVPNAFLDLGIALYLYIFAIQSGPVVLNSKNKDVNRSLLLVIIGLLIPFSILLGINASAGEQNDFYLSMYPGVMLNSAGIATLLSMNNSTEFIPGFSIAYLISQFAIALILRFIPNIRFFHIDLNQETNQYSALIDKESPRIIKKFFTVSNAAVANRTLKEISFLSTTACMISAIDRNEESIQVDSQTKLQLGDIIMVYGTEEHLKRVQNLIGEELKREHFDIKHHRQTKEEWLIIRSSKVVNKAYTEVNPSLIFHASILEVRRGNVSFSISPDFKFRYGDQIKVSAPISGFNTLKKYFEGSEKGIGGNLMSIFWGILIGTLIGQIQFSIGGFSFNFGIFNGILITGLLLGRIGKTGPMIWSLPKSLAITTENIGLYIFLAVIGFKLGGELMNDPSLILTAMNPVLFILLFSPLIIVLILGRFLFKISWTKLLGFSAGIYGNILAYELLKDKAKTNQLDRVFALTLPLSAVILVLILKMFGHFLI